MTALGLLTLLLQPPGATLSLLLMALLCVLCRRRRTAAVLALLAGSWLWWWATPLAAGRLTIALESRYPLRDVAALPTADAILLLGGDPRGWQPACASQAADCSRSAFAGQLFAAQRAPLLLASGAGGEAAQMRAQLLKLGVPADAIIVEPTARNTRENMRAAAPLLRARGVRSVLLVTSALHMPRAMANAAALGMAVVAAPTARDAEVGREQGLRALLPSGSALQRSQRAFKEYLGLAYQAVSDAAANKTKGGRSALPPSFTPAPSSLALRLRAESFGHRAPGLQEGP